MPNLPSGTVTFLFSDIEGSTALLKRLGDDQYAELLRTHRRLVREIFAEYHGQEIDTQGDAFFYSFHRAREAVAAAVAVQRGHADQSWPDGVTVRIRLGLHTGEPAVGEDGYTGLDVVRASRIAAVGRGGQVLLSDTTRAIVAGDLPDGVAIRSLGDQRLKDIDQPEALHELTIQDVPVTPVPVAEPPVPATPKFALESVIPPEALANMPSWLRETATRLTPVAERASHMIEARVMAEIADSMREDQESRDKEPGKDMKLKLGKPPKQLSSGRGSMADEIAKLKALRDDGTLTQEQYERALDRILENTP